MTRRTRPTLGSSIVALDDLLKVESEYELLVRGHLWITHLLEGLILADLPFSEEFAAALERMSPEEKVALASAQGNVIYPQPMQRLAKIRNTLAHHPERAVNETLVQQLVDSFPADFPNHELYPDLERPIWNEGAPAIETLRRIIETLATYLLKATADVYEAHARRMVNATEALQRAFP